jgi:hypothetical protein
MPRSKPATGRGFRKIEATDKGGGVGDSEKGLSWRGKSGREAVKWQRGGAKP